MYTPQGYGRTNDNAGALGTDNFTGEKKNSLKGSEYYANIS